LNGFCADGDLLVAFANDVGTYTAGTTDQIMQFGWFDGNPVETAANGTCNIPASVFAAPADPVGVRVSAGGLFVALQCLMCVDSAGVDGIATCATGPNVGLPCNAPFDNSNNACNDGTDAGLACSQTSATACTFGTPATIGCVNADCGSAGGIAHVCSPPDLSSPTPDSALISFPVP
jgi:hypothetical protein